LIADNGPHGSLNVGDADVGKVPAERAGLPGGLRPGLAGAGRLGLAIAWRLAVGYGSKLGEPIVGRKPVLFKAAGLVWPDLDLHLPSPKPAVSAATGI
jgi:hypothetical protein